MHTKSIFADSTIGKYVRSMRTAPREVILNRNLYMTSLLFALCGVPITWDQGSSGVVPSLPGFQKHFGIDTGTDASLIRNTVSLVYIGCGVGALLSFFVNDRLGRLWSLRLYMSIWIVGQLVATFSPNLDGLYAARIISGLGIGPLTVLGPMTLVEVAPTEMRGLIASWFSVAMLMALFVAAFCVYGVFQHVPVGNIQFQIVWASPTIFIGLCILASFFVCESPRWLFIVNRNEEAIKQIEKLRGLPRHHPRVAEEIAEIQSSIHSETASHGDSNIKAVLKEAFTVPSNLRRVQQALVSYALAQLSGANSVTAYLVPILTLLGIGGDTTRNLFLSGMYSMAKFFFTLIASFFFIDALGRRRSLFIGITIQMLSDIYLGVFLKFRQEGPVGHNASQAAVAAIFIHGFGYAIGLLILPYVFAGELWPNKIRSFGTAITQTFHWLFFYGVNAGTPNMLKSMNNWGAFIFFGTWCFISLLYVFFMVPEIAGMSLEQMDMLFKGPWFKAYKARNLILSNEECIQAQIPRDYSQDEESGNANKLIAVGGQPARKSREMNN